MLFGQCRSLSVVSPCYQSWWVEKKNKATIRYIFFSLFSYPPYFLIPITLFFLIPISSKKEKKTKIKKVNVNFNVKSSTTLIFQLIIFSVHKIVRVVATRSIVTSGSLGKSSTDNTIPPNKDATTRTPPPAGTSGGGTGGGKKNTLTCPKCGDPCTHVETFVCKYFIER